MAVTLSIFCVVVFWKRVTMLTSQRESFLFETQNKKDRILYELAMLS